MPKKTYYFDKSLWKRNNTGKSPFEPLADSDDLDRLVIDPDDEIRFRAGQAFDGNFVLSRSGAAGHTVKVSTYRLGNERTRWAKINADATTERPISFDVNASYVDMDHITAQNARYAGFRFRETQGHINGDHLRMRHCGIGARLRGSFITLTHADSQDGEFSRADNLPTDEGAVVFSAEGNGYVCSDITIANAYAEGAIASSGEKIDGGKLEIFGDVKRLTVQDSTFVFGKGGIEAGGPTPPKGVMPTATAEDIQILRNVWINCGIFMQVNNLTGQFPGRLKNWLIRGNTYFDRTRTLDAVWIQGDRSDIDQLTFDHNIYDGLGNWIGTDGATDVSRVKHTGNVYNLPAGKKIGYDIGADEYAGDPGFANPAGFDFRLKQKIANMAYRPGALDMFISYVNALDLKYLLKQTRTPIEANDLIGGLHSYASHRQMWAIHEPLRRAGMECTIWQLDRRYRLDADKLTWWLMGEEA